MIHCEDPFNWMPKRPWLYAEDDLKERLVPAAPEV
jgi:hypothetical protein